MNTSINHYMVLFFLFPIIVFAHEGKSHDQTEPTKKVETSNDRYLKEVKPIFQTSCFNCHSSETEYPWYYKLPGAKQLIDSDIRDAKEHLDMTKGFPFAGHHSVEEQLGAIKEVIEEGSMPPLRYRLMHWGSGLTISEKKIILQWISEEKQQM